ncbi:MAG: hypothetical protein AB4352_28025 [Hormoscilla sp.]
MSQGHQAQATPKLHPVLQGALRSLDVNLESELKRYRRAQAGEPLQRGLTVSSQNGMRSDAISAMHRLPALQNSWLLTAQSNGDRVPYMSEVRPQRNHRNTEQLAEDVVEAQDADASLALISAAGQVAASSGSAPDKEVAIAQLEKEPDDYLESSEELLKSLASPAEVEAATSANTESCRKSNLLTPLGIGSMLLLLMTGGTLWFAGKDPSLVGHLKGDRPVEESNPKQANTDMSERVAVDLNLDSISRLPTSSSSSPQQVSSPADRERSPQVEPKLPVNSPATAQRLVEIPTVVPIPRTSTQLDGSTEVASELSTQTDAAFGQYYYVVASDPGVDSREQIEKIIPEATVRDFPQGRFLQLGVFREESRARALVENLADRGIYAQIYKHRY